MPIVANPAAPFAPQINERFAASEQFNKIFPTLAGLYEASGRNYTQASAQTAQNQTQASAVSAGLEARRIAQEREAEFNAQRQQQQIAAQMAMQERAAQMEMERMNFRITKQEEMENTTRMNGLVEIERQLNQKLITPEQAADARYELITGINAFQRRQQHQQAQAMKQQEQIQQQQIKMMKMNEVAGQALTVDAAMSGKSAKVFFGKDGSVENIIGAGNDGKLYNVKMEREAKEGVQTEDQKWQASLTDKGGQFDYAAAEKRSKMIATYDPEKRFADPESEEAEKWIRDNVAGMYSEWSRLKSTPQQAPVTAPQQGGRQPGQNDQMGQQQQQQAAPDQQRYQAEIQSMMQKKMPPALIESVVKDMEAIEQIIASAPYGKLSEKQKGLLAMLESEVKRRMGVTEGR